MSKKPLAGTASHSTPALAILLFACFLALPMSIFLTPVAASNWLLTRS